VEKDNSRYCGKIPANDAFRFRRSIWEEVVGHTDGKIGFSALPPVAYLFGVDFGYNRSEPRQ
jgi:hypothetical protein